MTFTDVASSLSPMLDTAELSSGSTRVTVTAVEVASLSVSVMLVEPLVTSAAEPVIVMVSPVPSSRRSSVGVMLNDVALPVLEPAAIVIEGSVDGTE